MKWIKVQTDIFANPKIQLLLKERDGDTFVRVWIQLLTLAGQSEQQGKIMMSENSPMTIQNLSAIMNKSYNKMQNILNSLIHLEMIQYEENTYIIKNWYEYQSIDKYEKALEQNRVRQKRYREKKKEENNVMVTLDNAKDKNKIDEINNKIENNIYGSENGSGFRKVDF